jgi:hypothetical protein
VTLFALKYEVIAETMKILLFTLLLFIALSTASSAQTFQRYPCTADCSGHEAGYDWAQASGVIDESGCGGNSNSFIEGCKAFVEENDNSRDGSSSNNEEQDPNSDSEEQAE